MLQSYILAACGNDKSDESSEKEIGSVESNEKSDPEVTEENVEEESEIKEVAEIVVDDEYLKATLVNVEHQIDRVSLLFP